MNTKLERLEREYKAAHDAGDAAAMERIAAEYNAALPMDSGAAQMLEGYIAEYFRIKEEQGGVPPLTSQDLLLVPGSNMVH